LGSSEMPFGLDGSANSSCARKLTCVTNMNTSNSLLRLSHAFIGL
jgi:hypothetical protein